MILSQHQEPTFKTVHVSYFINMSHDKRNPTKWNVHPAKTQISQGICSVWSVFAVDMEVPQTLAIFQCTGKTLMSLKGCPGWLESYHGTQTLLRLLCCCSSHYNYSRLSLSRNRRDPPKHFEISVLWHIRFIVLRKKLFEQPHFTNDYVIWLL